MAPESKNDDLRSRRSATQLGGGLEKFLSAYAAAAAAAGVGMLALTPRAGARVIYTPASTNIPFNGGAVLLDLNHDGIADFSFSNASLATFSHTRLLYMLGGAKGQSNRIWGRGSVSRWFRSPATSVFASALRSGFRVGSDKSHFQKGPRWLMASYFAYQAVSSNNFTYGQWLYTKHRYLGLKFMIGGDVHYGWARFKVSKGQPNFWSSRLVAVLTGYAYETVPNKPIITGKIKGPNVVTLPPDETAAMASAREQSMVTREPAGLGRLAQGASGVPVWRKSAGRWQPPAH